MKQPITRATVLEYGDISSLILTRKDGSEIDVGETYLSDCNGVSNFTELNDDKLDTVFNRVISAVSNDLSELDFDSAIILVGMLRAIRHYKHTKTLSTIVILESEKPIQYHHWLCGAGMTFHREDKHYYVLIDEEVPAFLLEAGAFPTISSIGDILKDTDGYPIVVSKNKPIVAV